MFGRENKWPSLVILSYYFYSTAREGAFIVTAAKAKHHVSSKSNFHSSISIFHSFFFITDLVILG